MKYGRFVRGSSVGILQKVASENRMVTGQFCLGGRECRRAGGGYDWDGRKRHAPGGPSFLVYQHTLSGRGEVQYAGREHRQEQGRAFVVLVPSDHRYHLPKDSPEWTFFWVVVQHPYVVSRLSEAVGPVLLLEPGPAALVSLKAQRLLEILRTPPPSEPFAEERALFDWMLQVEEAARGQRHPDEARRRVLDDLRAEVLRILPRPVGVEELARAQGQTRSQYSHAFRSVTGCTPAAFMRDVRLQEVKRRLLESDQTLDAMAAETGFADANHLCKAFRRSFGLSPGGFRQQAGRGEAKPWSAATCCRLGQPQLVAGGEEF